MKKEEFTFLSADKKTQVHGVKWLPETSPIGVIQIVHGVTEYILRYEEFAKFFTSLGYIVVGHDILGHGKSISDNNKMYFGPNGSYKYAVADIKTCFDMTKQDYQDLPYTILGFSMGSFLVRSFLITNNDIKLNNAILLGTGNQLPLEIKLGKFMANKEAKRVGENHGSEVIDKLTFETYNKGFAPNRTKYDWLCSNDESIDKYIADKNIGPGFTSGLFRELLNCMEFCQKQKNVNKMNPNLNILLASGSMDPVGNYQKGVNRVKKSFEKVIKNIDMKIYPNLRHDILNEKNKEEIFKDISNWLASIK